jgi:hypothetical protein
MHTSSRSKLRSDKKKEKELREIEELEIIASQAWSEAEKLKHKRKLALEKVKKL